MSQKESEKKPEDYAKKCPYRIEDCPIDYPKESEWEEKLEELMAETGDYFYSSCEHVYPDTPEDYYEKEYEKLLKKWKLYIKESIVNREKEIAEEVEKMKKDALYVKVEDDGTIDQHEAYNDALNEVLQLLKH